MGDKLRKATHLRMRCQLEIESLHTLAEKAKIEKSIRSLFRTRCRDIQILHDEYVRNHNLVLGLLVGDASSDLDEENTIYQGFIDSFYKVKSVYSDLFEQEGLSGNVTMQLPSAPSPQSNLRLPKVDLPRFRGNFKLFVPFIELYNALVHESSSLSPVEKYQYLVSCLEGEPAKLVTSLPLTNDNYIIAYQSLVDRYSNSRILSQQYWSEIQHAPKMTLVSSTAIRNLVDVFVDNLAALKTLGLPTSHWDFVVSNLMLEKLHSEILTRFELHHSSKEMPEFQEIVSFLEKHCMALQQIDQSSRPNRQNRTSTNTVPRVDSYFAADKSVSKPISTCGFCRKQNHLISRCFAFRKETPRDRYLFCKNQGLCFVCMSPGHNLTSCKEIKPCKFCEKTTHHELLHFGSGARIATRGVSRNATVVQGNASMLADRIVESASGGGSGEIDQVLAGTGVLSRRTSVLLSTARICCLDSQGRYQSLRSLLDSGSQSTFISKKALDKLGLMQTPYNTEVRGIGNSNSELSTGYVTLTLKPEREGNSCFLVDVLVLNSICQNIPSRSFASNRWNHVKNLNLADPEFNTSGRIDLLIGVDLLPKLLLPGIVTGNADEPIALNTVLGYVLMGSMGEIKAGPASSLSLHCQCEDIPFETNTQLSSDIRRFWESETVPEGLVKTSDDVECEKLFVENCHRDPQGRYIVSLPFKEVRPHFPRMRELALSRFIQQERRLLKQPELYQLYRDFMHDYLNSDHMEVIESYPIPSESYYLVHHGVLKPDSSSTRLRVVFNGSAKLAAQPSLNDCLLTGPKLQQDIFTILLNFRVFSFALCSDIKQMYRMVWIEASQRDYQRIVWRFSPEEPIRDYRLKTITYGLSSAPFLALRCLHQLCIDEGERFPLAREVLLKMTFVDDCIFSVPTKALALETRNQLISLLSRAGFDLRKWASNNDSLLSDLPEAHVSSMPRSLDCEEPVTLKVLGLRWNPAKDIWFFEIRISDLLVCTKRVMLSNLARIYDPMGLLSPITFLAKTLIQRLWISKIGWDNKPPEDIAHCWKRFITELPLLRVVNFPRLAFATGSRYQLHGFCDASKRGIGAALFVRSIRGETISSTLLCSKSKVASLKNSTIPRLELDSMVLLTRLVCSVLDGISDKIEFENVFLWADSQISLYWVSDAPTRWKTFVANRVAFIQNKLPDYKWYYIDTRNNPADFASRGLFPSTFMELDSWIKGPSFLQNLELPLRSSSNHFEYPFEEERKLVLVVSSPDENVLGLLLNRFSSFIRAQRVLGFCLRFVHNLKNSGHRRTGSLGSQELLDALLWFVRFTQQTHFVQELENKVLSKPLRKLNAFIDEQGILRVGGRLEHSRLSYAARFPILLPRSSQLTSLLITHYHKKYFHCGLRTTQYLLCQNFWILSCKRAVNSVVRKCLPCWKRRPVPYQPRMAPLPASRVLPSKAFEHTGVDFGGPFFITLSRHRGVKTSKAYLCLFVCFATKAVHLELASDLTSQAFLAALQRFMARRGRVSKLYCDNATNFVGASRELNLMKSAAESESLSFVFSPPAGPHFNGLAEAGIKSVKGHLAHVLGDQILNYEEFYTVLTLIEALLNSRPLTALTSDIEDLEVLTPGHFLTLAPLSPFPVPDVTPLPLNRLSRWQLIQRIQQDFWKRWHVEYLHTLQQRGKWLTSGPLPVVGDLVLIHEENSPPSKWSMGKITTLYPGKDGVARVASVQTATGILKRPLVKLCPLPALED